MAMRGRDAGALILAGLGLVLACGSRPPPPVPTSRFPPSSGFAHRCDDLAAEKQWVRSTLDEVYLWNDDIVDVDAGAYATPEEYYAALLVRTPTGSGRPKDNWSTAYPASTFQQDPLWHGVRWEFLTATDVRALYVRPRTPASDAGVQRGDRVVAIGGVPVEQLTGPTIVSLLYPDTPNQDIALTLTGPTSATRTVTMTDVPFDDPGVLFDTVLDRPGGKVGYLAYTSQLGNGIVDLQASVDRFLDAGVSDLVVDIRYNPGGSAEDVSVAGSLIGGLPLDGKVFAYVGFNARTEQAAIDAGLSAEESVLFVAPPRSLGLDRVYFLTTGATCSASEMLINGLVPFLDVGQVGGATCGKPYGFLVLTNCGTTYLIVVARVSNALHHGDYADGIAPQCAASDDLSHALGDPTEGLLAAALGLRETGQCPPPSADGPAGLPQLAGPPLWSRPRTE